METRPDGRSERIALFDLDGTLADFDGSMERGMKSLASPSEIAQGTYYPREQDSEPEYIRERRRLVKRQPGFWRDLRQLPTGFWLLERALELQASVSVLTKAPRTNFPAWSEKVEWCHRSLPMERGIQVNLVEDKGLVYGRMLVDDWPKYISRWLEWRPRGLVIMPAQPWNVGFDTAWSGGGKIVRCDISDMDSMARAFEAMREQLGAG